MTTELKPCPNPWCASEVRMQKMVNPHTHKHRVICDLCDLTGPYGTDEQEAATFWNTRPEPALICHGWASIAPDGTVIAGMTEEFVRYYASAKDRVVRVKIVRDE